MAEGDPNVSNTLSTIASAGAGAPFPGASAIGFGLSAIPEFMKLAEGIRQRKEAERLKQGLVRPTYNIPGAITDNEAMLRGAYLNGKLPGQQYAEDQLGGNTASAIRNATLSGSSPAMIAATIAAANQNQNTGVNQIAAQAAANQNANRGAYSNALNTTAQYQDKAWNFNVNEPYQARVKDIAALRQAGSENQYSAFKGLAGSGIGAVNNLFPGQRNTTHSYGAPMIDNTGAPINNTSPINNGVQAPMQIPQLNNQSMVYPMQQQPDYGVYSENAQPVYNPQHEEYLQNLKLLYPGMNLPYSANYGF